MTQFATIVAFPLSDFDSALTFGAFVLERSSAIETVAIFVRPGCRTGLEIVILSDLDFDLRNWPFCQLGT